MNPYLPAAASPQPRACKAQALSLGLLLCLVSTARADGDEPFEDEPRLDAAAIVQPALLSAPNATVAPEARVHGYMARFALDTPFGPLAAESVELLAIRQAEIPAIETLEQASRRGAFAHALGEKFKKTGQSIWQVVSHPVGTVAGLPAGVARYFRKQIERWSGRAQSVSDRAARELGVDGDPFRGAQAPMSSARAALPGEITQKVDKPWYGSVGKEIGREARRQLDYSKMRRQIAQHLGVDPSSSNPLLRERLDTLAWAAVAGNFTAGTALDAVGGTAAEVMSVGGRLNSLVWELDEENLRERNRVRIARWCSDEFALRQFLRRGGFNDSLRTALADELDQLKPAKGCNDLIEIGAGTRSELEARYLVNALRLLRSQQAQGGELFVVGAALAWRSGDGNRLLLPLPLDWLSWTADMGEFFAARQFRIEDKSLLIGGEASATAQRALARRGWNLHLRLPYAGAPAYADDLSQGLPTALERSETPQLCVGDVAETAACL
ncbi:hypothetical protein DFR29_107142 [Tahibacter aquaticus]|uniref:Uncharacterized protein n=1 Tax=Tahibacter aquaticus TaxID=520092 RepID=A0A4R6YWD3_9GAMM|nr:hypothetical protein [Tahibacter aquaticus]TDR43134.1 hypothetical protein DFR29_107142 [Tahibacter aquaticus]